MNPPPTSAGQGPCNGASGCTRQTPFTFGIGEPPRVRQVRQRTATGRETGIGKVMQLFNTTSTNFVTVGAQPITRADADALFGTDVLASSLPANVPRLMTELDRTGTAGKGLRGGNSCASCMHAARPPEYGPKKLGGECVYPSDVQTVQTLRHVGKCCNRQVGCQYCPPYPPTAPLSAHSDLSNDICSMAYCNVVVRSVPAA